MEIDDLYVNRVAIMIKLNEEIARNKNLRRIFADKVYSVILRRQIVLCEHLILSQIRIIGFDASDCDTRTTRWYVSYGCINSRTKIQTN